MYIYYMYVILTWLSELKLRRSSSMRGVSTNASLWNVLKQAKGTNKGLFIYIPRVQTGIFLLKKHKIFSLLYKHLGVCQKVYWIFSIDVVILH
jgi:hypothetical protein